MLNRRDFLRTVAAAGGALAVSRSRIYANRWSDPEPGFGIHPLVEGHPDAVFILLTNVDVKTNSAAKKQVGFDFGHSVFISKDVASGGTPISRTVAIKPNLTSRGTGDSRYTVEGSMGIVTDAYFVEGIIESMKALGLAGNQFYIREVNSPEDFQDSGYIDMAARTGADIRSLSDPVGTISESDLVWRDVPNGIWFSKIPYLWPINAPDTWLLNVAKFKAHSMGLTLCAKNLQGSIAAHYQQHCTGYGKAMSINASNVRATANADILANYNRHLAMAIPRWDRPGNGEGGIWQETWASRCLDNNSVTQPALHIIEGIYGRDGNWFDGPDGHATDYMTNVVVFGKNPFAVDIIGHWLGGHEPGNFGLFHMALERGMTSILDPGKIPLFEWKADGTATARTLADFPRTPLKTLYLRRDYNGQTEEQFHLVDEPYNYETTGVPTESTVPEAFVVHQNYPNPFNSSTSIEFFIPESGDVRLEICDIAGAVIAVPAIGYHLRGSHLAVWNTRRQASGVYFYRFLFKGHSVTRRMVLLR